MRLGSLALPRVREPARAWERRSHADATAGAPNPHRQTRRVYKLRSYVWCTACARRMFGRTVFEYTYYTCQPRDRIAPEGHPRTLSLEEDLLLDLTTRFFNTYVFGIDRVQLAASSVDIAAQQAAEEHQQKIHAARYALADIEARKRRLFKILEQEDDDDGSLYRELKQRRAELDTEYALKQAELEHLEQTMPTGSAAAVELLDHLPHIEINLANVPAERLRPFLDAFAVQINYDLNRNRVTFQATISAQAVPHLNQIAHTTIPARKIHTPAIPRQRAGKRAITSTNTAVPADDGGDSGILQFYDMPRRGHPAHSLDQLSRLTRVVRFVVRVV